LRFANVQRQAATATTNEEGRNVHDTHEVECPDCEAGITRRDFVKVVGGAAVAAGAIPLVVSPRSVQAAPTSSSGAETAVKRFYDTLSDDQRKVICLPFDHELRSKVHANWAVTEPQIKDDFYSDAQRELIDEILRGVTSEDGYQRFQKQMQDDRPGGVGAYHVAVFGDPGSGKFEWEMTGRHLTLRADGDSVASAAFGGPIVYGHGAADTRKNVFYYQTKKANEVFAALDADQAVKALLPDAPRENQVPIQGTAGQFPGVPVSELSSDQQELVESVIGVMLAPYRPEDVSEALAVINSGGGFDKLHMAFYQTRDLNKDEVWDIWRVEGPSLVWHFRGAPHVHTYLNVGLQAESAAGS